MLSRLLCEHKASLSKNETEITDCSQKCGKVSDLVRSLLVTGEGSFVVHLHSLLIFDGELGGGRGKLSQHPQKHFSFIIYSERLCFFIHFSVSNAP